MDKFIHIPTKHKHVVTGYKLKLLVNLSFPLTQTTLQTGCYKPRDFVSKRYVRISVLLDNMANDSIGPRTANAIKYAGDLTIVEAIASQTWVRPINANACTPTYITARGSRRYEATRFSFND